MNSYTQITNIVTDEKSRDIIFIFYNDYLYKKEKYNNSSSYAEQLMHLSIAATNNSYWQKIDFCLSNELEHMLVTAKHLKFKIAIIQTPGHVIRSNFIENLKKYVKDKKWLTIAHVLEKQEYIQLHDQCIVINLENLDVDEMDIGLHSENVLMPMYDRSEDNFHDDYLPKWVKFNDSYKKVKTGYGWKLIAKSLINYQLLTFDDSLRSNKIHLYPENPGHYETWNNVSTEVNQMSKILKENQGKRALHIYNNETCQSNAIKRITKCESFDTIVVPASGFYGVKMAKEFNPGRIFYYDVLDEMLDFRKSVDTLWDGKSDLLNYTNYTKIFINPENKIVNQFSDKIFENQQELSDYFSDYKKIYKEYHKIDVISQVNQFIDLIPKTGKVYIWLNSIYTYWNNIWAYKPHNIQNSYDTLMNALSKFDNEIWIQAKEPTGEERLVCAKDYYKRQFYVSGYQWR